MAMPKPTGISIPNSRTRSLTTEMISPPLSPEFNFDAETVMPSIRPALEYISGKLQQRRMHVTLLVGRGKPFPTGQPSDLIIIPVTPPDPPSWRVLERAIAKAARKFALGRSWADALHRSQYERQANQYLVQQSILQNEVVFSQEGLTLLNLDRIYTFKRRLCVLSHRPFSRTDDRSVASCVRLLRRIVTDFHWRPFSKAFFHRVYEQLDVRDELLAEVAAAYQQTHQQEAIILPPPARPEPSRKSPPRAAAHACRPPPPKTPQSASDVTPVTRNEWNILVRRDLHQVQPSVTTWTPSPTMMAAA